jgi:2-keto-3-deoxy-galactonokinase
MALLNQINEESPEVVIVGSQILSRAYQLALGSLGVKAQICDPTQIAVTGYQAVYQSLNRDRQP